MQKSEFTMSMGQSNELSQNAAIDNQKGAKRKCKRPRKGSRCISCNKKEHDYTVEEALTCIPPQDALQFGEYTIDPLYRAYLYKRHPTLNAEQVVGSFLGKNPYYLSQEEFLRMIFLID
jgi:hypothetical protein